MGEHDGNDGLRTNARVRKVSRARVIRARLVVRDRESFAPRVHSQHLSALKSREADFFARRLVEIENERRSSARIYVKN